VDALASEELAGMVLGPTDPSSVQVAKTASRSVLRHINEITFEAQHLIAHDGGLRLRRPACESSRWPQTRKTTRPFLCPWRADPHVLACFSAESSVVGDPSK
jgi:hypothetical protein